jgi:spore coat polysaccharide biosynthesis predicted glycosyltransferase SpsG
MAVVFRVAAGPRLGFGHLARCRALAAAMGVVPSMSVRGSAATRRAAARLGVRVLPDRVGLLGRARPALVVVDDPSSGRARVWVRAARRLGVPVAALHDAGIGRVGADLVIDGSIRAVASSTLAALGGPRFAVVDPRIDGLRAARRPRRGRICVAVGGGAHVFALIPPVVAALARVAPGADIRVAPGFTGRRRPLLPAGQWLAPGGLAAALADAEVAVVAGGLTAYEACALGVPAVAVSVVPAQRPTVAALARHGAVVDGGALDGPHAQARVGARVAALLAAPAVRRRMATAARRLVDGRGARRIARALSSLVMQRGGYD